MKQTFRANGKLMITGEYLTLDGAKALAIPTQLGQTLSVHAEEANQRKLEWKSYNHDGSLWFDVLLDKNLQVIHTNKLDVANRLQDLLIKAVQLNPEFYSENYWYEVTTQLEFDREWGLGSSSTLVSLVAQWAGVDGYELLQSSFGGSGYDVACGTASGPITYQLIDGKPVVEKAEFKPPFSEQLFFYYTGKKQLSDKEVSRYRDLVFDRSTAVTKATVLTDRVIQATDLKSFQEVIQEHEVLISEIIQLPTVKEVLLPHYQGVVKSLGAWGGDFVLLAGEPITGAIPYDEMILNGRVH